MCSLAPRAAALGLGTATAFLDQRRGVAAAAPANHRMEDAPSRKRGRDVDTAPSSALQVRMDKELTALQGLLKRAKLLPRSASAAPAEKNKNYAPAPRRSEAPLLAAKRMTPESKAPAVNSKQQQRPVQHAGAAAKNSIPPKVTNKHKQPPVPPAEEDLALALARATEREEFRQMLLEMEKAVLPDETIYPEDLLELGIWFEHAVTRTRKQAWLEDHAKKVKLVGV